MTSIPSASELQPASNLAPRGGLVAVAHATLERHGRSFALAGRLLPRDRRDDAAIVYAFCRLVDDTADEADDPALARAGLDLLQRWLRSAPFEASTEASAELQALGLDGDGRRLVAAFVEVCQRRQVDLGAAEELIIGVRADLGHVEVQDDAELLRYGYRVAGTVGLMMCGVLGVKDPKALAQAIDLGVAMQITNICRDVREDAGMGRVYLPAQRLLAAGLTPAQLCAGDVDRAALASVVRDLLALADVYYRSAAGAFAAIPLRARVAIIVASGLYRAIGLRLLRRYAADSWHGRTVVPGWAKAVIVGRSLLRALRFGPWSRSPHRASLHRALA